MKIERLEIPDVVLIKPAIYQDSRGEFLETYNERAMQAAGLPTRFVQDNLSVSRKGVVRGLHYQFGKPQGKLVRVALGEVFDVAVDLRRSSPSFGRHVSVILSQRERNMLWIPEGFAHGFVALSDQVCFEYKVTDFYSPESEVTVLWNDPDLSIQWPISDCEAIVSAKDAAGVRFRDARLFD
jgi:dTDP-4-dehydrorhamnose 3,5-epimerase